MRNLARTIANVFKELGENLSFDILVEVGIEPITQFPQPQATSEIYYFHSTNGTNINDSSFLYRTKIDLITGIPYCPLSKLFKFYDNEAIKGFLTSSCGEKNRITIIDFTDNAKYLRHYITSVDEFKFYLFDILNILDYGFTREEISSLIERWL